MVEQVGFAFLPGILDRPVDDWGRRNLYPRQCSIIDQPHVPNRSPDRSVPMCAKSCFARQIANVRHAGCSQSRETSAEPSLHVRSCQCMAEKSKPAVGFSAVPKFRVGTPSYNRFMERKCERIRRTDLIQNYRVYHRTIDHPTRVAHLDDWNAISWQAFRPRNLPSATGHHETITLA